MLSCIGQKVPLLFVMCSPNITYVVSVFFCSSESCYCGRDDCFSSQYFVGCMEALIVDEQTRGKAGESPTQGTFHSNPLHQLQLHSLLAHIYLVCFLSSFLLYFLFLVFCFSSPGKKEVDFFYFCRGRGWEEGELALLLKSS
jgi:hypothetical protein